MKKIWIYVTAATLVACAGEAPKPEATPELAISEVDNSDVMEEDDFEDGFDVILPSPLQIASIMRKSGLPYVAGVTNPEANANKYGTKLSKSLNFGVYSADMSYCVLNQQNQEARAYMKLVRQMASDLGIENVFQHEELFESFERNLGNEDSLIYIIASIQEHLDDYLETSEQEYMAAVYFTGAWVEAMYVASQVVSDEDKQELSHRFSEQMGILENLIKGLEYHPNKVPEFEAVLNDLRALKADYDSFESTKALENAEELTLESFAITDEEMKKAIEKIVALRTKIVNG